MRWRWTVALLTLAIGPLHAQRRRYEEQRLGRQDQESCPQQKLSFELVTGYVYTAPADMLDSQPGTLMLTDCIDICAGNSSCKAINYETGLCVLFSSSADDNQGQLTPSQFPVFTIYVQKNCLPSASLCDAAWNFDRVMDYELDTEIRKRGQVESRQECMELCLSETDFECRSCMFTTSTGECRLAEMDRHSLAGRPGFGPAQGVDYMEANCVSDPDRLCLYDTVRSKILKTVDAVYQAIASEEDCKDLCNNAPFRCHSFDYNDTGDNVCRLSHHSAMTLTQIEEPYLVIEEATTYQLSACYNVSIDCHSGDMTANIRTSSLFGGKVYAKGSPVTCMVDVDDSMEFSITMAYTDLACGVEREGLGGYTNDVIIQHHDSIVTSADLGLQLSCEYDLTNKSVSNNVDLTLTGAIEPTLFEENVVDSPNVVMKIADKNGQDAVTAVVGDPLTMVWEILDLDSPYEISVRDLVAVDGATDTELQLIDANGCPTDSSIMGEVRKSELSEKILLSSFDAFRFPTSEVVQFRAMITPCLPKCKPVQCDVLDYTGQTREVESYGKRKKRSTMSRVQRGIAPDEMLVIQTLKIVDKYGKRKTDKQMNDVPEEYTFQTNIEDDQVSEDLLTSDCLNKTSMVTGAILFLFAQVVIVILFAIIWRRNHNQKDKELMMGPESRTDSLSYMYETGLARRLQ